MAKVVAFVGAHGTGKSTLVEELCKDPKFTQIVSATRNNTDQAERRIDPGVNLDQVQLRILEAMQIRVPGVLELKNSPEMKNQVIVLDRSAIDFYAYSKNFLEKGLISSETFKKIEDAVWDLISYIDIFYYLPIEFGLVDDGVRNMDEDLRQGVDTVIRQQLPKYGKKVVELNGTLQSRFDKIKATLEI